MEVPLPNSMLDLTRGLSKRDAFKQSKILNEMPEAHIKIPSRYPYDPLPTYEEGDSAKSFTDYWATQRKTALPIPLGMLPANYGAEKHVIDQESLTVTLTQIIDHLRIVLMERLQRGLESKVGLSLEGTVEIIYK